MSNIVLFSSLAGQISDLCNEDYEIQFGSIMVYTVAGERVFCQDYVGYIEKCKALSEALHAMHTVEKNAYDVLVKSTHDKGD